ncbi:hypothetical protein HYALB_00012112 [Hymenoscyphus albidus]|uniref:Secreted protein n=1 Tax=Hymenoscyphus albidus TaxID=595503 RepID=A0A9N9LG88_9HELO|nr:hypothetical protein HYALB_00012112 [Hymenoscyphus albidus]
MHMPNRAWWSLASVLCLPEYHSLAPRVLAYSQNADRPFADTLKPEKKDDFGSAIYRSSLYQVAKAVGKNNQHLFHRKTSTVPQGLLKDKYVPKQSILGNCPLQASEEAGCTPETMANAQVARKHGSLPCY